MYGLAAMTQLIKVIIQHCQLKQHNNLLLKKSYHMTKLATQIIEFFWMPKHTKLIMYQNVLTKVTLHLFLKFQTITKTKIKSIRPKSQFQNAKIDDCRFFKTQWECCFYCSVPEIHGSMIHSVFHLRSNGWLNSNNHSALDVQN